MPVAKMKLVKEKLASGVVEKVPPCVPYEPGRKRGRVSSSASDSESVNVSPLHSTLLLHTGQTRRLRVSQGSIHLQW